jgi:hypothetical protein
VALAAPLRRGIVCFDIEWVRRVQRRSCFDARTDTDADTHTDADADADADADCPAGVLHGSRRRAQCD